MKDAGRTVRISTNTFEKLERLGKVGDTFDEVISELADTGLLLVEGERMKVTNPETVTEIFEVMRHECFENDRSPFLLHMIPCEMHNSSFEVESCFSTVLNGCIDLKPIRNVKDPRTRVVELIVNEGNMKSHDYIVTPSLPDVTYSNMGIALYSYVFIGAATSGYSGTGPLIKDKIDEILKSKGNAVSHTKHAVRSTTSFAGLFYERGPVVGVWFPGFEVKAGGSNLDTRFVRRYEE